MREKKPDIHIVAVEPSGSPLLSKGYPGGHGIPGLGADFMPETLDTSAYDEVIDVDDEDAYEATRSIARKEGILAGVSSGAALYAARVVASRPQSRRKCIVVILPDTGARYLSTEVFA